MGWIELLADDVRRYPGRTFGESLLEGAKAPGLWALAHFRIFTAAQDLPPSLRRAANAVLQPVHYAVKIGLGIELSKGARIGKGLWIGHWGSIHVSPLCRMGEGCNLAQDVTIGVARSKEGTFGAPTIGDRVYIGAGAKVLGPIKIGNDVAIGANAVVVHDVPDGVSVGGVPARVISEKGSRGLLELGRELVHDPFAQLIRQPENRVVLNTPMPTPPAENSVAPEVR